MDFGLLAPALIGGAMVIVGAIIIAWMNAHKPTLELSEPEEDRQQLDLDLDKAGKMTRYRFAYQADPAKVN